MSSTHPFSGPREPPDPAPAFLLRMIQLAGWPPTWGRAARWSWGAVLVPVVLWMLLPPTVLVVGRGIQARYVFSALAASWDAELPRIEVVDGHVLVADDRVVRTDDGNVTFLLDTKETVPIETLTAPQFFVIRETELVRKQGFQTTTTKISDLQAMIGGEDIVLDSASLLAFDARWGLPAALGITAFMYLIIVPMTMVTSAIYAVMASLGLLPVTQGRGLGFEGAVKTALAASVPGVLLSTLLFGLGYWPGACLGTPLMIALTWAAGMVGLLTAGRGPAAAPP